MWDRVKSAWLVLRGRAYAVPYATHYEAMLWEATGAKQLEMSQMQNPDNFDVVKP